MRKKLAAAAVAAAFVAAPVAAVPAQASETHVCNVFADPYGRVCQIALDVVCNGPIPPLLSICQ